MKPKKFVVLGVVLLGTFALVTALVALKPRILEQWYLWQLDSEIESEREVAAKKLGQLRSVKAIPQLIRIFRQEYTKAEHKRGVNEPSIDSSAPMEFPKAPHYSIQALIKIGQPAVPALVQLLKDDQLLVRGNAAFYLGEFAPTGRGVITRT